MCLGGKALNKVATWSTVAWLLTVPLSGNVLAQSDAVQSTQQAVQTQVPAIAEHQTALRIPLYDAVQRLDYDQLKELLEAGEVDVNAQDKDGNTALHIFAKTPQYNEDDTESLLDLFLAHGLDPTIKNNKGRVAIWYVKKGQELSGAPEYLRDLAYWIETTYGINGKDNDGETALGNALYWAYYNGDMSLARKLVARGADVRIPAYYGHERIYNHLDAASILMFDRDAFVSLLFEQEKGIVNVIKQHGQSLLQLANKWGNKVVADVLDTYGVNNDSTKPTIPLYDAVKHLNYSELKELLERGVVDVNAQDKDGSTAFHIMLYEGRISYYDGGGALIRLILAHGADIKLKNNAGKTILSEIAWWFEKYGEPKYNQDLAFWGKITHGINGKDEEGRTPLEYALSWANYSGDLALARQLISEGADVRLLNFDDSWNYLDVHNPLEAAAVLIEDREAFISLLFEQEEGIVDVLKQRGAHLLELADKWDNKVVVDTLTEYGVE